MAAVTERRIAPGEGTPEAEWLAWPGLACVHAVTPQMLLPSGCRVVVVAPHPDDEILLAGGLLAWQAQRGGDSLVVAVTDGGASHPRSTFWPPERLLRERPRETQRALVQLGFGTGFGTGVGSGAPCIERLQLPDGGLATQHDRLVALLLPQLRETDVVLTTWRLDGHPDHEATARAAAEAAAQVGAVLIEVPVWAWHWARPGDARLPWHRARRVSLDPQTVRRKQAAIRAFSSQLHADPSTGCGPILRRSTVARCDRDFEIVLT